MNKGVRARGSSKVRRLESEKVLRGEGMWKGVKVRR
jgi:hypothetical protein